MCVHPGLTADLKRRLAPLLAIVVAFALSGCAVNQLSKITVDRDNSYFSDFEIDDGKVYFKCYITLESAYPEERQVLLVAVSHEDVANGLLKSPFLLTQLSVSVPANGSISQEVTFIGQHNGGTRKHDRLLPEVRMIEVGRTQA